jgi:hypothetical protein
VNSFSLQHILALPIPKIIVICISLNNFNLLRGSKIIDFLKKLVIALGGPEIVEKHSCVVFTKTRKETTVVGIKEELKKMLS